MTMNDHSESSGYTLIMASARSTIYELSSIRNFKWRKHLLGKVSEIQMGFKTTTLRDLARRSNYWATGDAMVSRGEMWVFNWNRIARPHSQIMTCHIWSH